MNKAIFLSNRIRERIQSGTWPVKGVLPPSRSLARELGCSLSYCQKALGILKEEGILEGGAKSRFRVLGYEDVTGSPGDPASRAPLLFLRVADNICREKPLHEDLHDQALPSRKRLCLRHQCSEATLVKSLLHLQQQGLIAKRGRLWTWVRNAPKARNLSTIYFLAWDPSSLMQRWNDAFFVQCLEREVLSSGYPSLGLYFLQKKEQERTAKHRMGGYVFLPRGNRKGWGQAYRSLPEQIPLVFMDQDENATRMRQLRRECFRIHPDNFHAGKVMAQHLLSRGHGSILFFARGEIRQPWSKFRFTGLRDTLAQDGSSLEYVSLGKNLKPIREWSKFRNSIYTEVRNFENVFIPKTEKTPETYAIAAASENLKSLMEVWLFSIQIEKIVAEQLQQSAATAWVGLSDVEAVALYLALNRIKPNRYPALAGFDNSPLTKIFQLTSYDFDMLAMAKLALKAIQNSGEFVRSFPKKHCAVSGFLVPRMSTLGPRSITGT